MQGSAMIVLCWKKLTFADEFTGSFTYSVRDRHILKGLRHVVDHFSGLLGEFAGGVGVGRVRCDSWNLHSGIETGVIRTAAAAGGSCGVVVVGSAAIVRRGHGRGCLCGLVSKHCGRDVVQLVLQLHEHVLRRLGGAAFLCGVDTLLVFVSVVVWVLVYYHFSLFAFFSRFVVVRNLLLFLGRSFWESD